MKFVSTRNRSDVVSSATAIKKGLSADGGLFVPESFPELTDKMCLKLMDLPYIERASFILKMFLDDFSIEELADYSNKAYGNGKFDDDIPAPLYEYDDKTHFLELWHGPTCAFKDMALQMLPHLLTASVKKTGDDRIVTILVATSGDTGKAALDGFSDVPGSKIVVFYPKDGVSDIQKLQMITQKGQNVGVFGVLGNFDDAQTGVKEIFTDEDFKEELSEKGIILSSANSINWGRLVPQIVYYISSYLDLVKGGKISMGEKINICVPTGNFGNILAAYYAKNMGLPVNKLICASNSNNILTDFINTGIYNRNRDFILTMSPSMDILISSNLERYLYDASGKNDKYVSDLMADLKEKGIYQVTDEIKNKMENDFYADFATEAETLSRIKEAMDERGYLMDTHTAVASVVMNKYREKTKDNTISVIASTASPYKFSPSVLKALGEDISGNEFEALEALNKKSGLKIPDSLNSLKNMEKRFLSFCGKTELKKTVEEFLIK